MKSLPPPGTIARGIQPVRDLPQGPSSRAQQVRQQHRLLIGLVLAGIALHGCLSLLSNGQGYVLGTTQLHTPRFLRCERIFSALENRFSFVLSEHGKQGHGKGVRVGHATADKIPLESRRARMKLALRLSRSSLAMSSVLPTRRASFMAASSRGRWFRLPLSQIHQVAGPGLGQSRARPLTVLRALNRRLFAFW